MDCGSPLTSLDSLPAKDPENQGGRSIGCSWGDYDNDGWLDLFVANRAGQNDILYHNNGDGKFTKVLGTIEVNDQADTWTTAWGDYDNDGFLDLFVGNRSGTSFLYHNNTNDNHWVKFRLIGTRSNRAAIGAKVRVRATINGQTFWQMREVPAAAPGARTACTSTSSSAKRRTRTSCASSGPPAPSRSCPTSRPSNSSCSLRPRSPRQDRIPA